MSRISHSARGAAVLAAVVAAGCTTLDAVAPANQPTSGLFQSYVSLGNSITAGYQSGGILDSTQKQSYAVLLAAQMGTRFNYPSVNGGDQCRLVVNFLTQATNSSPPAGTPCLRNAFSQSDVINNVAVPGATSADPTSNSTPASNGLTGLFLSGRTQVEAALAANPTFATIWIGNNDVLSYAIGGQPGGATSQATFVANYSKMMSQLLAGAPNLKGALIGVVQVANAPVLFSAQALQNPAFVGGLGVATGKTITVDASCTPTSTSLISFAIVSAIRAGTHPPTIYCAKQTLAPPLGDVFVLDAAEQVQTQGIIDGYNGYIKAKADSLGWAYVNVNDTLTSLRAAGAVASPPAGTIPSVPNIASATVPFGTLFSLDGVHPTAAAHKLIANIVIDAINAKFSTSLAHVQ